MVLGAFFRKATEPTSATGAFWVEYASMGVLPALIVLWLPQSRWIVLTGVGASLAVELAAVHLIVGCFSAHDCIETTLAAIALPFVYLYCLISMPIAVVASTMIRRSGSA
jgi:hypothetical protein